MNKIIKNINDRINSYNQLLIDEDFMLNILDAGHLLKSAVHGGKAILICGNGGSAAEAAHMSGEIVGRFKSQRTALPSISLASDIASITAIANDFGYDEIFARQVEAYRHFAGAVVLLSTSGNSENLLIASEKAKRYGLNTVGLLGKDGGKLKNLCDISLIVPSWDTPIIQEMHLTLIHILCEIMEDD